MSGRTEKMKRLIAERDRLKAHIEALQNQLKGLETAIAVMTGEDKAETTSSPVRPRARNVKETVLLLVQNAGGSGISVNDLLEVAKSTGVHLERGTVSSLLSRMKRENVLDMEDGKYFVSASKPEVLTTATH